LTSIQKNIDKVHQRRSVVSAENDSLNLWRFQFDQENRENRHEDCRSDSNPRRVVKRQKHFLEVAVEFTWWNVDLVWIDFDDVVVVAAQYYRR
jgi:hypothetical protein